ncbi:uncharacterized protein apol [Antennarius striatus]|uniref:uncharacterized protein apol n=1 Tax=Antennarius striatus TaxID=241820 RepID=UPI0035AEB706
MKRNTPPTVRQELQEAFGRYTADTFSYIDTVSGFCFNIPKWMLQRESELFTMMDIKDRADAIDLDIGHVTNSENKGEAFRQYVKSKFTGFTADNRLAELEKELAAVLKGTLAGLEKLDYFLDAVEKLAVTSLHVFMEDNRELHLPKGFSLERVQVIIAAARMTCPLLLEFKRDAKVFFLPRLQNVEVLAYQLDSYIQTTQKICVCLMTSFFSDNSLKLKLKTVVDFDEDISDDDVQTMLHHINQLEDIRSNQNFKMVFLFQDMSCESFMKEFSDRRLRMREFLTSLEDSAVQLDRMKKGAKISSVAGSSVGVVGGVLSIVGLALIPVTAGVSLSLTLAGLGLGVTSGANSIITTATEMGVNSTQTKKAREAFQSFMEDVKILQDCLEDVINRGMSNVNVAVEVGKLLVKAGALAKSIDAIVDAASTVKLLKSDELITSAGRVAVQEGKGFSRVASDIPDIGQAAVKGPLALSKSARAGLIVVNALFIGVDVFFICKDSISLHQDKKPEASQFIRARAELWSSEMDSWKKIHDSLHEGLPLSQNNQATLDKPFYTEMEMKKKREAKREMESDKVDEKPGENQFCVIQ